MNPSMELPLVAFTVLSQFAIGIAFLSALRATPDGATPQLSGRRPWLLATGMLAVGIVLSLLHLGHPLEAPRALTNLASSWLAREVLLACLLVVMMALMASRLGRPGLVWATAAVGLITLLVQGLVYSPPGLPALHNAYPFAFFLLTAVTLGAGAGAWFAPPDKHSLVRGVLLGALCCSLLLYVTVPLAWLNSGTVERLTAQAWLASPFYWIQVVVGLLLPLVLLVMSRRLSGWLPWLLLVGAIAGRIGFYADSVHSAANLGGLY